MEGQLAFLAFEAVWYSVWPDIALELHTRKAYGLELKQNPQLSKSKSGSVRWHEPHALIKIWTLIQNLLIALEWSGFLTPLDFNFWMRQLDVTALTRLNCLPRASVVEKQVQRTWLNYAQ